jgi:hypothetical protein
MEPLNDDELERALREWQAPAAPPTLERRVFERRGGVWQWLLHGSIRVPVPVGMALVALLLLSLLAVLGPPRAPEPVRLTDFQPVPQLEMKLIRSAR